MNVDDGTEAPVVAPAMTPAIADPRGPVRFVFAGLGTVVAIVLVGFAIHALGGHGGAVRHPGRDEPVGQCRAARDPIGVAALVAPGELASVTREVKAGTSRAAKEDLLKSSRDPLGFLAVSVADLHTKVTDLAPGFAKVEFDAGRLGYSVNPKELPKSWNVDSSGIDPSETTVRSISATSVATSRRSPSW